MGEKYSPEGVNNLAPTQSRTFLADVMGISKILHILVSGVSAQRGYPTTLLCSHTQMHIHFRISCTCTQVTHANEKSHTIYNLKLSTIIFILLGLV